MSTEDDSVCVIYIYTYKYKASFVDIQSCFFLYIHERDLRTTLYIHERGLLYIYIYIYHIHRGLFRGSIFFSIIFFSIQPRKRPHHNSVYPRKKPVLYMYILHTPRPLSVQHTATHCNTLQHTATHIHVWVCEYINITFTEASLVNFNTAYCIWMVICSFSNLNWWSSSLGLFYHVPLKRDYEDWDSRLRLNDPPNAIAYTCFFGLYFKLSCQVFRIYRIFLWNVFWFIMHGVST